MHQIPFLLISMALGFWILTLADNQSDRLKLVGRIVGWVILIVAAGGLICSAAFGFCRSRMCPISKCHMMGKMDCPGGMSPAMAVPAEAPQK